MSSVIFRAMGGSGGGSGTFTPVSSVIANMTTVTPGPARWIRQGRIVSVWGSISALGATIAGAGVFDLTLPIASNLALASDLSGVFLVQDPTKSSALVLEGTPANDKARFSIQALTNGVTACQYAYAYEVL